MTKETATKGNIAKHSKLTNKQKAFTKAYVKNKQNGTQAIMEAYDVKSVSVASAMGTENLAKPKIKEEIARLLENNEIFVSDILKVHKRNMLQDKHLPTSQKAVGDFYDILGLKNTDKATTDVKIAFVIEK